jgi:cytochrome c553
LGNIFGTIMKKVLMTVLVSMGVAVANAGGNASAGQAKAAVCGACHGADGNSMAAAFPKLAGQGERYLVKQLQDIKCGFLSEEQQRISKCTPRSVPQMAGQLNNLSDQDMADIAAYYASQPVSGGQAKEALVAKGEAIYRGGISSKGVAACSACHSPSGKGNAPAGFPALSGQHADYIAAQLKAFRAGADGDKAGRNNDGETRIMRDIAIKLTDSEIEAVSSYASGLR